MCEQFESTHLRIFLVKLSQLNSVFGITVKQEGVTFPKKTTRDVQRTIFRSNHQGRT